MAFSFFKRLFRRKPQLDPKAQLDFAMAKVSLFDDVVSTRQNADGTFTIFVRGPVAESYDRIVKFLKKNAPGLHGDVRRAAAETPAETETTSNVVMKAADRSAGQSVWIH